MMLIFWVWSISIVFNTGMILRSMKKDKARITPLYLFYYFTLGTIIAPLLAIFILIGVGITIHHWLYTYDILNKTIYRFK
jgi:hypothetical protein